MLNRFRKQYAAEIDEEIMRVYGAMDVEGATSEEYPKLLEALERLEKLRDGESRKPIDLNQTLTTLGYFAGVVTIVTSERWYPAVSKAFQQLQRPSKM